MGVATTFATRSDFVIVGGAGGIGRSSNDVCLSGPVAEVDQFAALAAKGQKLPAGCDFLLANGASHRAIYFRASSVAHDGLTRTKLAPSSNGFGKKIGERFAGFDRSTEHRPDHGGHHIKLRVGIGYGSSASDESRELLRELIGCRRVIG